VKAAISLGGFGGAEPVPGREAQVTPGSPGRAAQYCFTSPNAVFRAGQGGPAAASDESSPVVRAQPAARRRRPQTLRTHRDVHLAGVKTAGIGRLTLILSSATTSSARSSGQKPFHAIYTVAFARNLVTAPRRSGTARRTRSLSGGAAQLLRRFSDVTAVTISGSPAPTYGR